MTSIALVVAACVQPVGTAQYDELVGKDAIADGRVDQIFSVLDIDGSGAIESAEQTAWQAVFASCGQGNCGPAPDLSAYATHEECIDSSELSDELEAVLGVTSLDEIAMDSDVDGVSADVAQRVLQTEHDVAVAALAKSVDEVRNGLAQTDGSVTALADVVDELRDDHDTLAAGAARVIRTNTTLTVGIGATDQFATIDLALASLDDAIIARGATVTIDVADGYDMQGLAPITIDHRDGDNIRIVGHPSDATQNELRFVGHGFQVNKGNVLGGLDGFTLIGPAGPTAVGVHAGSGAVVFSGPRIKVQNFNLAFEADSHGVLFADGTTAVAAPGVGRGYVAQNGAYVQARNATATGQFPVSFHATSGGGVDATDATASNDMLTAAAFEAAVGSWMYADGTTAIGPSRFSYYATTNGTLVADSSTVVSRGSAGWSYVAEDGAVISMQSINQQGSAGSPCIAHSGSLLHVNNDVCASTLGASPAVTQEQQYVTNTGRIASH